MSGIPDLWHPETVYLNTASFGLPPDPVWDAVQTAQADWRAGRVSWEHWTAVTGRARAEFATLVHADARPRGGRRERLRPDRAGRRRDPGRLEGARRPSPSSSSLLFPFLAQAERGVTVEFVPLDRLAEAIDASTDVVAVSAVQSSTGEVAALDDIAAAARHHGALTVDRRDPRDRLAAAGRVALRRGRLRRLQVADEPARHGVPGARRGARASA